MNSVRLNVGDSVICRDHPELSVGRVKFLWRTGNVDVAYPNGRILINWPHKYFDKKDNK